MGLDPDDDSYPAGDACVVCIDELFDGVTPATVLAIVHGIEKCPWVPIPPFSIPNGSFYLSQEGPCSWAKVISPGKIVRWTLQPGKSTFVITQEPAVWFFAEVMLVCHDAFANTRDCDLHATYGTHGYATVWWGPHLTSPPL